MGVVGSYGDIVFQVSADKVRTWEEASRTGKARWARHELLGRKPIMEYTGPDLATFALTIRLDAGLGVDPAQELKDLQDLRDGAEPKMLVLGGRVQGLYALESIDETWQRTDKAGNILLARARLALTEYITDAESLDWKGYNSRGFQDFAVSSMYSATSGGVALGNFSLSSLLPGEISTVLKIPRISDILGRIPNFPDLGGITDTGKAVIGSVLGNLRVPSDFSAAGMKTLITSMKSGALGWGKTEAVGLLKTTGIAPEGLAELTKIDGVGALKTLATKIVNLPPGDTKVAVSSLVGKAASGYMQTAIRDFAARLA